MTPIVTETAVATGGRAGVTRLADNGIALAMALPTELGGSGKGMNPEQLFALGYASCYGQALVALAPKHGVDASKAEVTCAVTLNKDDTSFVIGVAMTVAIPGADKGTVQSLADAAHQICPYSRATRDNIDIAIEVA